MNGKILTTAGALGTIAAFMLAAERVQLLLDPNYIPTCSINPILSCGSVMTTWQASAFGFPNSLIGLGAFPVVLTLGILLLAKVEMPGFVLRGLQIGSALGVLFVHWLISQSLFVIRSLCPYCMVVWVVTVVLFASITVPEKFRALVLTTWAVLVLGLITGMFWDYWSTLI